MKPSAIAQQNGYDSGDDEETSSVSSAATDKTSRSESITTTTNKTRKLRRGRQKLINKPLKLQYKFACAYKEDHDQPLFGVQFNHHLQKKEHPRVFATVGSNRVTVYECLDNGKLALIQCYADPDPKEIFYTCAWSLNETTGEPLLFAAGANGVIRVFDVAKWDCIKDYVGHGHAINELKFHPRDINLLLSVSKDHTLRLWNIKTDVCVAIFGGVDGHRDEVLSADIDTMGERIVSSGMDHSLKIWALNRPDIENAVKLSYQLDIDPTQFRTVKQHFPVFSTRDIHRNYVDCVQWKGNFIISKSCENCAVIWKPGRLDETKFKNGDNTVSIIQKLDVKDSEIWFIKFSMPFNKKALALGNQTGKLYVWDLDVTDPSTIRPLILSHNLCTVCIRQTCFNRDGSILLAAADDGSIWRWDRIEPSS